MNIGFWNYYKAYNGNRMLESPHSELGDDLAYPTVHMAKVLRAAGHRCATLDRAPFSSFDAAVFFDHPTFMDRRFLRLIARRIPLYLFANESPMHRPDNYWRWNLWPFKKVFSWRTVWPNKPKNFVEFRLPVKVPENFSIDRTMPRNRLCAVFSNKETALWSGSLYDTVSLYKARRESIQYFDIKREIDLYGHGWDEWCAWRGTVGSKRDTMQGYKFALAYENSSFPGYVTEKLFDAMFAGCIPIYAGAQDIARFVPPETFLEARRFRSYDALRDYMATMTASEYAYRHDAIEQFVRGQRIYPFSAEAFARQVLEHVAGGVAETI